MLIYGVLKTLFQICNHFKLEDKVSLHLVEISPKQSKLQAEKICVKYAEQTPQTNQDQKHAVTHYMKGVTKTGIDVYWYYSIKDVPKGFSIFLAHEFFDALPIHKFQVQDNFSFFIVIITFLLIIKK